MFFVSDNQKDRHSLIREFLTHDQATIAIILAAIDFEWSLRRTILLFGYNSTKHIREIVLANVSGPEKYKEVWKNEVEKNLGISLPNVIPHWSRLVNSKNGAYRLRNQIVHGIHGNVTEKYATDRVEDFLRASELLQELASKHQTTIFKRIVRRKSKSN